MFGHAPVLSALLPAAETATCSAAADLTLASRRNCESLLPLPAPSEIQPKSPSWRGAMADDRLNSAL